MTSESIGISLGLNRNVFVPSLFVVKCIEMKSEIHIMQLKNIVIIHKCLLVGIKLCEVSCFIESSCCLRGPAYKTTLHNFTTQYNTIQYNTTQHNIMQHNTMQYNTLQHSTTSQNKTQQNKTQHNTRCLSLGIYYFD